MNLNDFFDIFDYSHPFMEPICAAVDSGDYESAQTELLKYFITRKELRLSQAIPITSADKDFSAAYTARHGILTGPNEADRYLSSIFVTKLSDMATFDVTPFIKKRLSIMIMSRQKEKESAFLFSPHSIFPPFITLIDSNGNESRLEASKYAFISSKEPKEPLSDEDIFEICEESGDNDEAYGVNTSRVYLGFDFSKFENVEISSARLNAKITLSENIDRKELLVFNIADDTWDNSLTWNKVRGNVYSWENSPTGPSWNSPEGSDCEYLNVICRFGFLRPMAAQYLSDVDKNSIYGEKLLGLVDSFAEKKSGGFNRVLECGMRISNFTAVLNAIVDTPAMTKEHLVKFIWVMYRDIKHLMENPDLGWSNWAVVRTCGLSEAIDFFPEFKEHDEWRDSTRSTMNTLFDRMYSPDFSFREAGFAYSFWCLELFSNALYCAQLNNDCYSAFMRGKLEKAIDCSLDLIYPNFYDTNVGDSNYCDKLALFQKLYKRFPTARLRAFLEKSDKTTLSAFYPDANIAAMRTTMKDDKAIYILSHATVFDGHAHNDLSSMVMYAYDRPLLADCGRYGYSNNPISEYLHTAKAHNTIEIEDAKYVAHSLSAARTIAFASNNAFDLFKVETHPYEDVKARHIRTILLVKKDEFAVVSDYIHCDESAKKFNQNWHFMPDSGADVDFNNKVETHFETGTNIKLLCPASDVAEVSNDMFSAGYGIVEPSKMASFTSYGQCAALTTLLLPEGPLARRTVSAQPLSFDDKSVCAASFNIDGTVGFFYSKNTQSKPIMECDFDGEALYVSGDRIFLASGKKLSINSVVCVESEKVIKDMYLHISGGIVTIESSSLRATTSRDEAMKIYAPKTTHVLFNGSPIPFTLYSDYVYALGV